MRDTQGYTIIEMLTVLFIIVIVAALVAPGLGQLMKRSKVSASVAAVEGVLRTARTLAITRNDVYHVRTHIEGGETWASVVWLADESQRYLAEPAWTSGETVESIRLEEKTRLTSASSLFFWPDGSASQETVFTVEVEDPDEHDEPQSIRVRASGLVEELP